MFIKASVIDNLVGFFCSGFLCGFKSTVLYLKFTFLLYIIIILSSEVKLSSRVYQPFPLLFSKHRYYAYFSQSPSIEKYSIFHAFLNTSVKFCSNVDQIFMHLMRWWSSSDWANLKFFTLKYLFLLKQKTYCSASGINVLGLYQLVVLVKTFN